MTLIEAVQSAIRRLHYCPRTEEAYLHWIRAFIRFHGSRHPRDMGAREMTAFLNHLAVQRRNSASTQNQALCALVGLRVQLHEVERRHRAEFEAGRGEVDLPHALRLKMPHAAATLSWQFLFPASRPCTDPTTGRPVLHHLHESAVQKAIHDAAQPSPLRQGSV